MKAMKRWLAALLALSLCLLCGCDMKPADPSTEPTATTAVTQPTEPTKPNLYFPPAKVEPAEMTEKELYPSEIYDYDVTKTVLPETVDNPNGLPVLKWVVLGTGISPEDGHIFYPFEMDYIWSDQAGRDVNAMLAKAGLPFRIQFVIFSPARLMEQDWFRIPAVVAEIKDADLVTGAMDARDMVKYFAPITENVKGKDALDLSGAVAHEYAWLNVTVDGDIYAVPSTIRYAMGNGWWVREEVFTELGFTQEDFQQEDIDGLFAQIYEKNGGKGFLNSGVHSSIVTSHYNGAETVLPGTMQFVLGNRYQLIGGCFAIDYSGEKPVVVNYLEMEDTRQYQQKLFYYSAMRYMASDYVPYLVDYVNTFSTEPYSYLQEGYGNIQEGTVWLLPGENLHIPLYSGSCYATGICKTSKNQDLALELLARLGNDEDFRLKLCYGFEGKDYVVENGVYRALTRKDGSYRMDFLSSLAAFTDFDVDDRDVYLPKSNGMTRLEYYRENVDNAEVWLPVEFNWVYMQDALNNINSQLRKYLPLLPMVGEGMYEETLTMIRKAGGDQVKAELQRQLDQWLEDHPEYASMLHN